MIVVRASWLSNAADWAKDRANDGFDYLADFGQFGLLVAVLCGIVGLLAAGPVRLPIVRGLARAYTTSHKGSPNPYETRRNVRKKRHRRWRMHAVGWFYGGQIKVESFTAAEGAGDAASFAAVVQDALGSSSAAVDAGVDVMVPSTESDVLADIADSVKDLPHGKVAQALLNIGRKTLPRDAFFLKGHLLPPADRGAGLTLALSTRRGRVRSTTTLWEKTYTVGSAPAASGVGGITSRTNARDGDAAPKESDKGANPFPYELALAGAAWAEYRISEHRRDPRLELLGTRDWQSYAYLQTGLAKERTAGSVAAQPLFARAVDQDATNVVAALNLAISEIREKDFDRAIARLVKIRVTADTQGCRSGSKILGLEPTWFTASYQLAAAQLMRYRQEVSDGGTKQSLIEIRRTARELCQATEAGLSELATRLNGCQREGPPGQFWRWALRLWPLSKTDEGKEEARADTCAARAADDTLLKQRLERWDRFLRRVEGPSLVLLASVQLPEDGSTSTATSTRDMDRAGLISAWESAAERSRGPSPDEIIGYLRREVDLDSRTHYNLACYYAERGKQNEEPKVEYDKALEELRYAVEPAELVEWSESDPSLEPLRKDREPEFEAVIGKVRPKSRLRRLLVRVTGTG